MSRPQLIRDKVMKSSLNTVRFPLRRAYCLLLCLLLPLEALAVELGSPSIRSFLGQRLDVRINVIDGNDENMQGALVSLAPVSEWVRSGVTLLPDGLTLQVSFANEDDNIFVVLRSQEPVREPVLQVLLNLQVTGQEVLSKPFILFLDPAPGASNQQPRNLGSSRARFNRSSAGNQPSADDAAEPASSPAPRQSSASGGIDLGSGSYGPVRQGETMWSIAERISRQVDFTPQQILLALQQANPNALEDPNNVNTLRSDVVLTLPDTSSLARTDRDQALALIEEQNRQWQASGRGARLELLRGGDDTRLGVSGGGDNILALRISRLEEELMATRRENEALRSQVDQLEGVLTDRESEISLSNQALADLERQLRNARARQGGSQIEQPPGFDQSGSLAQNETEDDIDPDSDAGAGIQNPESPFTDDAPGQTGLSADGDQELSAGSEDDSDNALASPAEFGQGSADQSADDRKAQPTATEAQNTDSQPTATDTPPPPATGSRWSWPLWESPGWREWQRQYGWLPISAMGFWLLVAVLVLIVALPVALWLMLRGGSRGGSEPPSDLLDRLMTQSRKPPAETRPDATVSEPDGSEKEAAAAALAAEAAQATDEQTEDEQANADDDDLLFATSDDDDIDDDGELKPEVIEGINWPPADDAGPASATGEDLSDEADAEDTPDTSFADGDDDTADEDDAEDYPVYDLSAAVDEDDRDLQSALDDIVDSEDTDPDPVFAEENDSETEPEPAPEHEAEPEPEPSAASGMIADDSEDVSEDSTDDDASTDIPLRPNEQDRSWSARGDADVDTAPSGEQSESQAEAMPVAGDDHQGQAEAEQIERPDQPAEADQPEATDQPEQAAAETVPDDPFAASLDEPQDADGDDSDGDDENREPVQSSLYDDDGIDVKLDLARAYLAMGDREAMRTILREIGDAGSDEQQQEVQRMRGLLAGE